MAEIKGKFITLAASLMSLYKDLFETMDKRLFEETGKHWNELDPEGWYDTKYYRDMMTAYAKAICNDLKRIEKKCSNKLVSLPPKLLTKSNLAQ